MDKIMDSLPVLIVGFCFGSGFLLAGVGLLFFALRTRRKSAASLNWPSTVGTVISSGVQTNTFTDEYHRETYSFMPRVEYAYTVNGQEYRGRRLHFGVTESRRRADAEREANRYPVGMQVKVYYDPEKPQEAVLEQKSVSARLPLVLGIIFLVLTLCTCLVSLIALARNVMGQ